MQIRPGYEPGLKCEVKEPQFKYLTKFYHRKGQNTMTTTKRIVRWETYEKDKDNMIASHLNGYWTVLSFGARKTRSKAKEIPVRQYRVSKDQAGNVNCTCDDFVKNNSVCKHQLKVWEKAKTEKKQQEAEREARVKAAMARW